MKLNPQNMSVGKLIKQFFCLIIVFCCISCKEEVKENFGKTTEETPSITLGKELFNGKGMCYSCHHPSQKIVGPSIKEIAQIYQRENANMIAFLKGEGKPIIDPSQYEIMKANFVITKAMSNEELKAIEDYMYSFISQ